MINACYAYSYPSEYQENCRPRLTGLGVRRRCSRERLRLVTKSVCGCSSNSGPSSLSTLSCCSCSRKYPSGGACIGGWLGWKLGGWCEYPCWLKRFLKVRNDQLLTAVTVDMVARKNS
jgi:hypothetical protein